MRGPAQTLSARAGPLTAVQDGPAQPWNLSQINAHHEQINCWNNITIWMCTFNLWQSALHTYQPSVDVPGHNGTTVRAGGWVVRGWLHVLQDFTHPPFETETHTFEIVRKLFFGLC